MPIEKRTVFSKTGRCDLCDPPHDIFEALECNDAPIRLLNGVEGNNGGFGLKHIESHEQRMNMIHGLGFSNVRTYLSAVLAQIDFAGMQEDGRLVLISEGFGHFHHVICQYDDVIGIWSVTTAIPKRTKRVLNKLNPAWERTK